MLCGDPTECQSLPQSRTEVRRRVTESTGCAVPDGVQAVDNGAVDAQSPAKSIRGDPAACPEIPGNHLYGVEGSPGQGAQIRIGGVGRITPIPVL